MNCYKIPSRVIIPLCLLFTEVVFSQGAIEPISWSADRPLQWSDFKGEYFETQWAAANTVSGIGYEFSTFEKDGREYLDIEVKCEFFPSKSWYRPELCDSVILSHERLHFDIAELYARKLRTRLAKTKFTHQVKAEVKAIYSDILKQLRLFQNKYDRETDFSRDLQQQLLWNRAIAKKLVAK